MSKRAECQQKKMVNVHFSRLEHLSDMFRQFQIRLRRKLQRTFLSDPEKMPQRVALGMAAIVFLSIIVTYNILFEKRKEEESDDKHICVVLVFKLKLLLQLFRYSNENGDGSFS